MKTGLFSHKNRALLTVPHTPQDKKDAAVFRKMLTSPTNCDASAALPPDTPDPAAEGADTGEWTGKGDMAVTVPAPRVRAGYKRETKKAADAAARVARHVAAAVGGGPAGVALGGQQEEGESAAAVAAAAFAAEFVGAEAAKATGSYARNLSLARNCTGSGMNRDLLYGKRDLSHTQKRPTLTYTCTGSGM